jgi:hypothetical protein
MLQYSPEQGLKPPISPAKMAYNMGGDDVQQVKQGFFTRKKSF